MKIIQAIQPLNVYKAYQQYKRHIVRIQNKEGIEGHSGHASAALQICLKHTLTDVNPRYRTRDLIDSNSNKKRRTSQHSYDAEYRAVHKRYIS